MFNDASVLNATLSSPPRRTVGTRMYCKHVRGNDTASRP